MYYVWQILIGILAGWPVLWTCASAGVRAIGNRAGHVQATFAQVFTVMVHASSVWALRAVVAVPINYLRESLGGATSLATVLQMVANGYGITLLPEVAVDVEARDKRVKLLRFAHPTPKRTVGLAWRPSSPRKSDFVALGRVVVEALAARGTNARPITRVTPAKARISRKRPPK